MSWIEETDEADAGGRLAEIYAELIEKRGKVANILKVHSLNPAAMSNHMDLYMTLMLVEADGLETLEPRLSNIVRHAEKLTSAPGAMTEVDLGELRAVGLSDQDILDITLIVGYFNFVNRIALGLGVDYSEEEVAGYKNE